MFDNSFLLKRSLVFSLIWIIAITEVFSSIIENSIGTLYIDSVFLAVCFCLLLTNVFLVNVSSKHNLVLVLGIAVTILISLLFGENRGVYTLLQPLFSLKFFLFYIFYEFAVKLRYLNKNDLKYLLLFIFVTALLGASLNIIMGASFNTFLTGDVRHTTEGVLRVSGFYSTPGLLSFSLILPLLFLVWDRIKNNMMNLMFFYVFCLFVFYITDSRFSLIPMALTFHYLLLSRFNLKYIIYPIGMALLLSIGWAMIDSGTYQRTLLNLAMTFDESNEQYIRGIMLYNSAKLSLIHFPFGAGWATFGTLFSTDSNTYETLGIGGLRWIEEGVGIYDSYWASLVGEIGVIGLLWTLYLLKMSLVPYKENTPENKPSEFIFILTIIYAFAYPILSHSWMSMIIVICFFYSLHNSEST